MKILAIEKELSVINWEEINQKLLVQEANDVYDLYKKGYLREFYFNEEKSAVLVLECIDKTEAEKLLNELSLVKGNLIRFELMELNPYTGFDRVIRK